MKAEKILFISHRIPYPPNKGDKIRSFHELKYFARHFSIDLITFIDDPNDRKYIEDLRKYCDTLYVFTLNTGVKIARSLLSILSGKSLSEGIYYSKKIKSAIKKLIKTNHYSFIFCYSSQTAQYAIDPGIPFIMDFCDVDSEKWREYSLQVGFPRQVVFSRESKLLRRYEHKIAGSAALSLFATEKEGDLFKRITGMQEDLACYILGNGVNLNHFSRSVEVEREKSLVFTGAMDYYANVDAVEWFVEEVFSNLSGMVDGITFYIVGSNPTQTVQRLGKKYKRVIVTGQVDDVRPFLNRARLAVIPLRIARGIQNKVLEAMAAGLPVVLSKVVYESLKNGEEAQAFVFENATECQNHILKWIERQDELVPIGKSLQAYVRKNYNWDSIFADFGRYLSSRLKLNTSSNPTPTN